MKKSDDQEAPMPYRLRPVRPPMPSQINPVRRVGCWPVVRLILLTLALLGCGIAEGVRKFAEPIDKTGCFYDCEREGMEFDRYEYSRHRCFCLDADSIEVQLY